MVQSDALVNKKESTVKQLKIIWICFSVIAILITITGCDFITYQYPFEQSVENVEKVELCRYDYETDTASPLVTLDEDTGDALLTDIGTLDCHKPFGDHATDYGEIVLFITYTNGEAEVVGWLNSATIDLEGEWWPKAYYFDSAEWCAVVLKYVDAELVPELGKYLE